MSDLEKYKPLLDDINRKFFHTENAYLIRLELNMHFNSAVNKEAAIAYRKIINSYNGFFIPVLEATLSYYMIGINQLFNSKDKKSLQKFVNVLNSDGKNDYRKELDELRDKHSSVLKSIFELRMNHFAHAGNIDLDKVEPISEDSNIKLISDLKIFMNKINTEIFNNIIWYQDGDSNESIKDTQDLLNCLLRGESSRLSEINVEYLSNIYKNGRNNWLKP